MSTLMAGASPNPASSPGTCLVGANDGVSPYTATSDPNNPPGVTVTPTGTGYTWDVDIPSGMPPPEYIRVIVADSDSPPASVTVVIAIA